MKFDPVIPGVLIFRMELIRMQDKKFPSHKLKVMEESQGGFLEGTVNYKF